jgi:hypothetical protein
MSCRDRDREEILFLNVLVFFTKIILKKIGTKARPEGKRPKKSIKWPNIMVYYLIL